MEHLTEPRDLREWRARAVHWHVLVAGAVLLATGGNAANAGFAIARALGHTIEPPVPSLFTLTVADARAIRRDGPAVAQVGYMIRQQGQIQYGSQNWTSNIQGASESYPSIRNMPRRC